MRVSRACVASSASDARLRRMFADGFSRYCRDAGLLVGADAVAEAIERERAQWVAVGRSGRAAVAATG